MLFTSKIAQNQNFKLMFHNADSIINRIIKYPFHVRKFTITDMQFITSSLYQVINSIDQQEVSAEK